MAQHAAQCQLNETRKRTRDAAMQLRGEDYRVGEARRNLARAQEAFDAAHKLYVSQQANVAELAALTTTHAAERDGVCVGHLLDDLMMPHDVMMTLLRYALEHGLIFVLRLANANHRLNNIIRMLLGYFRRDENYAVVLDSIILPEGPLCIKLYSGPDIEPVFREHTHIEGPNCGFSSHSIDVSLEEVRLDFRIHGLPMNVEVSQVPTASGLTIAIGYTRTPDPDGSPILTPWLIGGPLVAPVSDTGVVADNSVCWRDRPPRQIHLQAVQLPIFWSADIPAAIQTVWLPVSSDDEDYLSILARRTGDSTIIRDRQYADYEIEGTPNARLVYREDASLGWFLLIECDWRKTVTAQF